MGTAATETGTQAPAHGKLGIWDTVAIIVGIVIGSSVFKTPPIIFGGLLTPWEGLGVWLVGGVLALIGALCYAELATTYPKSGGDYVYLSRAFGRPIGFLFGWAQLVVILSGSAAAMAFIFGEYAATLQYGPPSDNAPDPLASARADFNILAALAAVGALSLLNFFGVVLGKWLQNALVFTKVAGLLLIVGVGVYYARPGAFEVPENVVRNVGPAHLVGQTFGAQALPSAAGPLASLTQVLVAAEVSDPSAFALVRSGGGIGLAMILVLYAFGGWNDAAFVAADLKNPRNITKALILGIVGITIIYLAVNCSYILALGWKDARQYHPTIAGVVEPLGPTGSTIFKLLVMVSALGAVNGLIFAGSRVYSSLGSEHRVFALLGKWNRTLGSPIWALLVQALITLGMILQVGTEKGRQLTDKALGLVNIPPIPWTQYFGGFDTLFAGTAPVFWLFFLLTGLSVFVLRANDPDTPRPFRLRTPWFPILPMLFCGMCLFGFISAMNYAGWVSLIGFVPFALGVPLYLLSSGGDAAPPAFSADATWRMPSRDRD